MLVSRDKENKQIFVFPISIEKCTVCDCDSWGKTVYSIFGSMRCLGIL